MCIKLVDHISTYRSRVWNDKKITAHHAIIPTRNPNVQLANMSEKEYKLYDLIRKYYIAQFFDDYEYLAKRMACMIYDEPFISTCSSPHKKGWKEVLADFTEPEDAPSDNELPKLIDREELICQEVRIDKKNTKPLARFTEGSLITAMKSIATHVEDKNLKAILKETAGLGTEATRANIIDTLLTREFIQKKGKTLVSTEKGRGLIALLPESITNPSTTALWEQQLESIAEAKSDVEDFIDEQVDSLVGMLEQLAPSA